ncbi:hypothetical protein KAX06_06095 [candidate division WOR-3 bacterium]|nr:hypothetical protein [candidate division WOR-3 bacterium]
MEEGQKSVKQRHLHWQAYTWIVGPLLLLLFIKIPFLLELLDFEYYNSIILFDSPPFLRFIMLFLFFLYVTLALASAVILLIHSKTGYVLSLNALGVSTGMFGYGIFYYTNVRISSTYLTGTIVVLLVNTVLWFYFLLRRRKYWA